MSCCCVFVERASCCCSSRQTLFIVGQQRCMQPLHAFQRDNDIQVHVKQIHSKGCDQALVSKVERLGSGGFCCPTQVVFCAS